MVAAVAPFRGDSGSGGSALTGPKVPFTTIPITTHKAGDIVIAAIVALGSLWLFPAGRSAGAECCGALLALIVIVLVATQSRGSCSP